MQATLLLKNMADAAFLIGYFQVIPPRWSRKLLRRSRIHRSWLSGYTGAGFEGIQERYQTGGEE